MLRDFGLFLFFSLFFFPPGQYSSNEIDMVYLIYENVCMSAKLNTSAQLLNLSYSFKMTQSFQKQTYTEIYKYPRQKENLNSKSQPCQS